MEESQKEKIARQLRRRYSSKSLKFYSILFYIFSVVLFLLSLPVLLLNIIFGAIVMLFSLFIFKKGKYYNAQYKIKLIEGDFKPLEFPPVDKNGQAILKIQEVFLSGITHTHDSCNPQDFLPDLRSGEEIFLKADVGNRYDPYAVKVLDVEGNYIGWLPSNTKDVFERLTNNETVLARLERTEHLSSYDEEGEETFDDSTPLGAVISYARYAKIRN